MLTWSPSCASLVVIRPFAWEKKRFAQSLQTDRQTDGRTDDGRRAIALAHSWNELKTVVVNTLVTMTIISDREFTCENMIHWFLLFSTSDFIVTVTGVFKMTFLHKFHSASSYIWYKLPISFCQTHFVDQLLRRSPCFPDDISTFHSK